MTAPKLTKEPVPITDEDTAIRLAVYGEGGAGKTTLALSFPRPLVVDTDGGLEGDAIAGVVGEQWTPDRWQDLNALYFWLKEQVHEKGYETIVIDSIDTLARWLLHQAVNLPTAGRPANSELTQLETASQQDYGKVAHALDIFLTNLKTLSKSEGIHIVLTSAVRLPNPEKMRFKRTFDVQPAVEAVLLYWANIYGELDVTVKTNPQTKVVTEERVLWTGAGDKARKNKARWAALRPGVLEPTYTRITTLINKGAKK